MRINKITLLGLTIMLYLSTVAIVSAAPIVFPTNHFMAINVAVAPWGAISTDGTLTGLTGKQGATWAFKTVDQFTCNAGQSELMIQIVKTDENRVIAATNPIPINAPYNGYIHVQTINWQLIFPDIGWYRFEVLIDKQPIAFYYFIASYNVKP